MAPERETLDIDVLFVGAGPASLAGAYRLATLIAEHNDSGHGEPLEVSIAVLEKGAEIGAHALSGAVVDPRALRELYPADWREAPLEGEVKDEKLLWLTSKRAISLPVPPMLDNEGKYVASLGKLVKWMAAKVEAAGVDVFAGFPGRSVLLDGERVVGVRTGDRGLDKHGNRKSNYEPGIDIRTKVVVLGEGPRGTLTLSSSRRVTASRAGATRRSTPSGSRRCGRSPGGLAAGDVAHTMGWPLDLHTFGGGFIYGMKDDLVIVGLVVGLDYRNPYLDPAPGVPAVQDAPRDRVAAAPAAACITTAPRPSPRAAGGRCRSSGATASCSSATAAAFVNGQRLKGIHLAMKSGMLAAETIFEALRKGDTSAAALAELRRPRARELGRRRAVGGAQLPPGLRSRHLRRHRAGRHRHAHARSRLRRAQPAERRARAHQAAAPQQSVRREGRAAASRSQIDGALTFDKLADVYNSATAHEEDQPVHLLVHDTDICIYQCAVEYANPCQRFCPANVYEMVADAASPTGQRLQINASNCVHCKTCDIMDPYQIITWVPPEGGGGPNYGKM